MSNYALIDTTGVVQNVVVWDGNVEDWQPPAGLTAVEVTNETGPAYIGGTYANGIFVAPSEN